jgi:hypothetical protein
MRRPALSRPVLVLVLLAACSKSEPAAPPTAASAPEGMQVVKSMLPQALPAAPAADTSKGSCEITVEGDVQATATAPGGPAAVGTDYWMTPEEQDKAVEMMIGVLEKDKAKAAAAVAEAKQREPKIMLLLLNCTSDKIHLTLGPGAESKYKDVPFAPGKYPITARAKAGEFSAMFQVDGNFFQPEDGGSFEISKFDASGITGTFTFSATRTDYKTSKAEKVTVKGKLDFPCTSSSKACKP